MLISKSSLPLETSNISLFSGKKPSILRGPGRKISPKKIPPNPIEKPGQRSSRSREIPSSRSPEKEDDFSQGSITPPVDQSIPRGFGSVGAIVGSLFWLRNLGKFG